MTDHPVLDERRQLCDLFTELGPDAPTLCDGWTTRDLAAHLWAREHRPDVGPGLVMSEGFFARHTAKVEKKVAERPYEEIVADLRTGPTRLWPGRFLPEFDVHEWFVHHEDVRRPNDASERGLGAIEPLVWKVLTARWAKMLTKGLGVGLRLETPDGRSHHVRDGDGDVVLTGTPGELLLHLFGRPADVTVTGDDDAVRRFQESSLGL